MQAMSAGLVMVSCLRACKELGRAEVTCPKAGEGCWEDTLPPQI